MDNNYEAYRYADLIVKHLKGELSALEEIKLKEWADQNPQNARLLEKLQHEDLLKSDLDFFDSLDKKKAWQNIVSQTKKSSTADKIYMLIRKWKYAAIAVVTLSAVGVVYQLNKPVLKAPRNTFVKAIKYKHDIAPGKDGAILTLTDGSKLNLDAGSLKNLADVKISKAQGLISYQVSGTGRGNKNTYNIISTPLGCKYKIMLPDGSKVWLNSSSSLKFPVAFTGNSRSVYLTGEAYFEVTKNKHRPFRVLSNNTVVQVLGTHFNIKAYKDEDNLKATLLEGSIKISKGRQSKMIVPGQQACINLSSPKIDVIDANLNESVAWKNDQFIFDSEDIEGVMRKVARWYNVQVEYRDATPQSHFSGSVSRNNNISQILNMLELTGGVHFKLKREK